MVMVNIEKPPVLVLARNPWLSGKLAKAAKEVGVTVRKFFYFRNPPPWSHVREFDKGASDAQKQVWGQFGKVSAENKGKSVEERIEAIRRALAGKKFTTRTPPAGYRSTYYRPRSLYLKFLGE
ncbi:MAG: hypothetical protein GXO68_05820 [Crenarchaeota archaeon]|nr:hypothetical protein [Thermoproteota archaeon]